MSGKTVDETWPYPERRYPPLTDPNYLGSRGLSLAVRRAIKMTLESKSDLDIVDVGCGQKPFYPFLQPYARSYIGTDVMLDNPMVDKVCPAEKLDLENESADLVLCLSVLEHVDDPMQSVRELYRVARPGGIVFASTHGAFVWHPYPQDHWRWTHTGLKLLFEKYGGFSSVELFATRGAFSGMFFFMAHYVYLWSLEKKSWRIRVRNPLISLLNRMGRFIDARTPGQRDLSRHVTLIPEYFVIARK